jgi:hypothetical protein
MEFGASSEELSSDDAKCILEAIVLRIKISIANIEVRNGQLRRLKEAHDTTWGLTLANLHARFSLAVQRTGDIPFDAPLPSTRPSAPTTKKVYAWEKKMKDVK